MVDYIKRGWLDGWPLCYAGDITPQQATATAIHFSNISQKQAILSTLNRYAQGYSLVLPNEAYVSVSLGAHRGWRLPSKLLEGGPKERSSEADWAEPPPAPLVRLVLGEKHGLNGRQRWRAVFSRRWLLKGGNTYGAYLSLCCLRVALFLSETQLGYLLIGE